MAAGLRISTSVFVDLALTDLFLEERFLLLFAAGLALWDLDFLVPEGYKVYGFWECIQEIFSDFNQMFLFLSFMKMKSE